MSEKKQQAPWDRHKNETNRAYAVFCAYRDLGSHRSLAKAAEKYYDENYSSKLRQIARWSSNYSWVKRVEEWDAYQEAAFRKDMETARREMAERQVAYGRAMQAKGITRIKDMLPDDLNPDQATRMIDAGVKIERVAMGENDKIEVAHTGEINQKVTIDLETTLKEYEDVIKKVGDSEDSA